MVHISNAGANMKISKEKEVLDMQVRMFRIACHRWKKSINECADIFEEYDIDNYIKSVYELFHTQGDEVNFEEIQSYLDKKKAGIICV